jgi:hypothetical protein
MDFREVRIPGLPPLARSAMNEMFAGKVSWIGLKIGVRL